MPEAVAPRAVNRQPIKEVRFPFDLPYQLQLLRLVCDDPTLAKRTEKYIKAHYFESGVCAWAYGLADAYRKKTGVMPSLRVLRNEVGRKIDPKLQPLYVTVLDQAAATPTRDDAWLRDTVLEFCKRNVYVEHFAKARDLYNRGQIEEAFKCSEESANEIREIRWEPIDRSWLGADFEQRVRLIQQSDPMSDIIPTQFPWLNQVLGGGLKKTEFGIFIAYAKGGKSTMLTNLVVAAALSGRRVLDIVLEGSLKQATNRLDSSFSGVLYNKVKRGQYTDEEFERARTRYYGMREQVVVRGLTDRWDVTIRDVEAELTELKGERGWVPDLIVIDYADLLRARHRCSSEVEEQRSAFQDVKTLANRGYAIWSASQAQRPKEGAESKPHVIYSRQIADCFAKVRIGDFLGSLNCTSSEYNQGIMRVYAELYRDNAANVLMACRYDPNKMLIWHEDGLESPEMKNSRQSVPLAIKGAEPAKAPKGPQQTRAAF